jgi:hypothetical protein
MVSDSSTAPLRLFIAIPIPKPVRDEIIRVQQELQPLVPRAVARWTNFISRSGSWAMFQRMASKI